MKNSRNAAEKSVGMAKPGQAGRYSVAVLPF
jgi:hypothetical protein